MSRCNNLIAQGYKFKKGDKVFYHDNKGRVTVKLDRKISDYVWSSSVNDNHHVKINNSGWSLF